MISIFIFLVILILVAGVCCYVIDLLPFGPPPLKQVAKAIIIIIALLLIVERLLPLAGVGRGL